MSAPAIRALLLALCAWSPCWPGAAADAPMAFIESQIAAHPGQSGVYVLETGAEALLARAWLADHAQRSIDVQYFIWSTDNIGILAAAALLRAADRGVQVRVIVDAVLLDAPHQSLLALAQHPRVDIRIYNPKASAGVPLYRRAWNLLTDFRGVNQRMHDKTVVVDGQIAVTGGRNMAAEYYDYNHEYNFRDRDALLLGEVVKSMQASFARFWDSQLTVKVEDLLGHERVDQTEVERIYAELGAYARSPENFAPEVRAAVDATPGAFPRLAREAAWGKAEFISDAPGKNPTRSGLGGGGQTAAALARLVGGARERVVIQSPYLVLSDGALQLFRQLAARGVRVRISTNSLASTDNIPAFSGYRNQRSKLLDMGLQIYEYRPEPEAQRELMRGSSAAQGRAPVFALHAKTLVVDGRIVYIGTFNFDPRSENLNTEVGVIIHDERLARAVEAAIEIDMRPGNSWNAASDDPDQHVSLAKRSKTRFWQMMPIKPLL
jgi:putative cardiolipin synthase